MNPHPEYQTPWLSARQSSVSKPQGTRRDMYPTLASQIIHISLPVIKILLVSKAQFSQKDRVVPTVNKPKMCKFTDSYKAADTQQAAPSLWTYAENKYHRHTADATWHKHSVALAWYLKLLLCLQILTNPLHALFLDCPKATAIAQKKLSPCNKATGMMQICMVSTCS